MQASSLNGQKIVILGGSSGLGFATAQSAIELGASVYIGGRNIPQLAQALAELGPKATGDTVDIGNEESVNHFFNRIDSLDHLVITAANNAPARLLEGSLSDLRISMDSRFWGAVMAIRAAIPKMSEQGAIVLTSGMVSLRPRPAMSIVAAAASAIESLARSLVTELAPRRINVINPGPMHTPLLQSAMDEAALDKLAAQLPLGKLGTGKDYAQAALFTLSNAYLNGSTIHLNGGAAWT